MYEDLLDKHINDAKVVKIWYEYTKYGFHYYKYIDAYLLDCTVSSLTYDETKWFNDIRDHFKKQGIDIYLKFNERRRKYNIYIIKGIPNPLNNQLFSYLYPED